MSAAKIAIEAGAGTVTNGTHAVPDRDWIVAAIDPQDERFGGGGQEGQCGWCKDQWGLSWQITPRTLTEGLGDPDPAVRQRVFDAMLQMKRLDVAALIAARAG